MSANEGDRDRILRAVRAKLGVRGDEAGRRGLVRTRIDRAPAGIIPARAAEDRAALIRRFIAALEGQNATVQRLKKRAEAPEAIAAYLRGLNMPLQLRFGADPAFSEMPWDETPIEVRRGPADGADLTSFSVASAAAAETGTLFLASGPDNPSTLNFLPETHIVMIAAEDIFGPYEEAWSKIRRIHGRGRMPRTVNLISGPSRTADIEQTIVNGAHGPKRLHVLLVSR
ncbi:MAG: lactate utilization protein [Hyphomicrobiales bacterium]|nr:lactate utilization protein [Hyphomicrobiales bacterium]